MMSLASNRRKSARLTQGRKAIENRERVLTALNDGERLLISNRTTAGTVHTALASRLCREGLAVIERPNVPASQRYLVKKVNCLTCHRELNTDDPRSENCGGDCLGCMAEIDPEEELRLAQLLKGLH